MSDRSLTLDLDIDARPHEVFAAVTDPRRWWSAQIVGDSASVGDEFVFEVPGVHFTRFRVTELDPERRVVWHAVEATMTFIEDTEEWTGTDVTFELEPKDEGTALRFTHVGLEPDAECYDVCRVAWSSYLRTSLACLAETGVGDPNQER